MVFPVASEDDEFDDQYDTMLQMIIVDLNTGVQRIASLPPFLLSAHTKICCRGTEILVFYCSSEPLDEDHVESDSDNSDSDSDYSEPESSSTFPVSKPLLVGRRLTTYRLKVCQPCVLFFVVRGKCSQKSILFQIDTFGTKPSPPFGGSIGWQGGVRGNDPPAIPLKGAGVGVYGMPECTMAHRKEVSRVERCTLAMRFQ